MSLRLSLQTMQRQQQRGPKPGSNYFVWEPSNAVKVTKRTRLSCLKFGLISLPQ